jgi:hypothetical protein
MFLAEWDFGALDWKLSQRATRPIITLNESPSRRPIRDYISYYHEDRIHDSLEKDSPLTRAVSYKADRSANLISFP